MDFDNSWYVQSTGAKLHFAQKIIKIGWRSSENGRLENFKVAICHVFRDFLGFGPNPKKSRKT